MNNWHTNGHVLVAQTILESTRVFLYDSPMWIRYPISVTGVNNPVKQKGCP